MLEGRASICTAILCYPEELTDFSHHLPALKSVMETARVGQDIRLSLGLALSRSQSQLVHRCYLELSDQRWMR